MRQTCEYNSSAFAMPTVFGINVAWTESVKGGSEKIKVQKRREAAVSAFLKDLPPAHTLLKLLLKDANLQSMTIRLENKMLKKVLHEVKAEARRTRWLVRPAR
jgi:hypothetical protein